MKRRDFVKHIPLGLAAASVPFSIGGLAGRAFGKSSLLDAILNSQTDTDRVLVIINLQGGNDGLNTVIPFQDQVYYDSRKEVGFLYTEKNLLTPFQLSSSMALNPSMSIKTDGKTATNYFDLWSSGKLAVIQNVGYANPDRSHFRATDIWNSASDSNLVVSTGWVARYLQDQRASLDPNDPPAISIGSATTLLFQGDTAVESIAISDPSNYTSATDYADDPFPSSNYGTELSYVHEILKQSDVYGKRFTDLFNKTTHPNATKNTVAYNANNPLAVQLQKVAWCINAGLKTRVYFVQQGGYDTHVNQNTKDPTITGQGYLLSQLAEAIATFQKDIENMGYADRVVGMTYSEFGRRVIPNGSHGTDHGTAAPMFVFGAGINGGLYGDNPNLTTSGVRPLDIYGDLTAQFDFRQVYAALLTQWFGANDAFRKAVLNQSAFTKTDDFTLQFPLNGVGTMQNLIKNPVDAVSRLSSPQFILHQNYPNPVRETTEIGFDLAAGTRVLLELFDARGEHVATLSDGYHGAGSYRVMFDAGRLSSGTYYYRLDAGGMVETKSMTIIH
ncbi:MAG: DUF1501 domain-containing protein [Bacteroidetes bacterium]|nr:DUF1501 domain-containing protein [Bacteroidota bacterium]